MATVGRQDFDKAKGRKLFNDFEPFQRVMNAPFNLSGRPRALSVDSQSILQREITPAELALAIASIKNPETSAGRSNVPRRPRRNSFTPSLPAIAEDEDEDILEFIHALFN